jgi:hypothetical protein
MRSSGARNERDGGARRSISSARRIGMPDAAKVAIW